MVFGVLAASVAWACDAPGPILDAIEAELLQVRLDEAARLLATVEPTFACGVPTSGREIARFWVLEGATAALRGEADAARDSFAAAARADAAVWVPSLGPALREQYDAAAGSAVGTGAVVVKPPGVDVRIDGVPLVGKSFPSGLHLVQAVREDGAVGFGRIVLIQADTEQTLNTGLVPPPPPPAPVAPVPAPAPVAVTPEPEPKPKPSPSADPGGRLGLLAGVGAETWIGEALSGRDADGQLLEEPATKLVVPIELVGVLPLGPLWVRADVSAAPLLGGRLLYGVEGEWTGLPLAIGGDLGAGWHGGPLSVGGLVGIALPGRLSARAVLGAKLGPTPLRAELRGGAHLASSGAVEPTVALALLMDFGDLR